MLMGARRYQSGRIREGLYGGIELIKVVREHETMIDRGGEIWDQSLALQCFVDQVKMHRTMLGGGKQRKRAL